METYAEMNAAKTQIVQMWIGNMDSLYGLTFALFSVSLVVLEAERTRFINLLRTQETAIWESLNRPSGYFASYLLKIDGLKLEKYIFTMGFLSLSNSNIKNIGWKLFYAQATFVLLLLVFILMIVVKLTTFQG